MTDDTTTQADLTIAQTNLTIAEQRYSDLMAKHQGDTKMALREACLNWTCSERKESE